MKSEAAIRFEKRMQLTDPNYTLPAPPRIGPPRDYRSAAGQRAYEQRIVENAKAEAAKKAGK